MKRLLAMFVVLAATTLLCADYPLPTNPSVPVVPGLNVNFYPELYMRMEAKVGMVVKIKMKIMSKVGEPDIWAGAAYDEKGGLNSAAYMPNSQVHPDMGSEDTLLWTRQYQLTTPSGLVGSYVDNWRYDGPSRSYGDDYLMQYVKPPGQVGSPGSREATVNDE